LAALNHPHIAAIYGFEADKDTHFLVLELIEGETLADWRNADHCHCGRPLRSTDRNLLFRAVQ
jgi:hypothetical protein